MQTITLAPLIITSHKVDLFFEIGSENGMCKRIEIKDNRMKIFTGYGYRYLKGTQKKLNDVSYMEIQDILESTDLKNWKESYRSEETTSNETTTWTLKVHTPGYTSFSSGNNSFPAEFPAFIESINTFCHA